MPFSNSSVPSQKGSSAYNNKLNIISGNISQEINHNDLYILSLIIIFFIVICPRLASWHLSRPQKLMTFRIRKVFSLRTGIIRALSSSIVWNMTTKVLEHLLHIKRIPSPYSLRRHNLSGIGIPVIKLERLSDRLWFIMGIPIQIRCVFGTNKTLQIRSDKK